MKVTINVVSILAVMLIVFLLLKLKDKMKPDGCGCGCNGGGSCGTKPTAAVSTAAQPFVYDENFGRY